MNDSILEIPITLSKFINIKVPIAGGVYFRVLPKFFVLNEVKKNIKSNTPILSYFHPYDVDTEQEKFMHSGINDSKFYNWLMYYNRKNVFNRLDNLLDRKSTRLNSSHSTLSRMPSSA